MKKVTQENNIPFNITKNSLDKVNFIIENMENKSFHNHYHILYDICDSFNHNDITYLEIGAFAGGSASLVSTNPKVKKVYLFKVRSWHPFLRPCGDGAASYYYYFMGFLGAARCRRRSAPGS